MELDKETKLAYEIAGILDDLESIDWHKENSRTLPESLLRAKLKYVLGRSDIANKAAYYNTLIKYAKSPRHKPRHD